MLREDGMLYINFRGGLLSNQSKAGMLYAALRRRHTLHRHPRICLRALRTHQDHLPIRQRGDFP